MERIQEHPAGVLSSERSGDDYVSLKSERLDGWASFDFCGKY